MLPVLISPDFFRKPLSGDEACELVRILGEMHLSRDDWVKPTADNTPDACEGARSVSTTSRILLLDEEGDPLTLKNPGRPVYKNST